MIGPELAVGVLGFLIFGTFSYVLYLKVKNGDFPKVRNPFYYE
jgi:hypothetical protein